MLTDGIQEKKKKRTKWIMSQKARITKGVHVLRKI